MTAICWDGETLAADNMAVSGSTKFRTQKLFVIEHHKKGRCMFAMSGNVKATTHMVKVLEGSMFQEVGKGVLNLEAESVYGILVDSERKVYDVYGDGVIGPASHELDKFAANGSAWEFLLGAMCAGACAAKAVTLANEYRTDSGFGVSQLNWKEVFADYNKQPEGTLW